jgi:hypothetical protein
MSGLNVVQLSLKRRMRDLAALSVSDQQRRLRGICDQRPLLTFADAVRDAFFTFPEIMPQSN